MSSERTRAWTPLLALAALTVLVRTCVAATLPDVLYPTDFILAEEQWRGSIAVELGKGPLMPFLDYQGVPFHGGPLVYGLLASPVFLLFGTSLFVLKLVAVGFDVLLVVCSFLVLDRAFERRTAWFGGLLVACPPPGYALLSTVAYGTHVESGALALLVLLLFLSEPRAKARARRVFATGIAAGFATYFGYTALLALAALLAFEWARDRRGILRTLPVRAAGFAAGLLPWFAYNLGRGFAGLRLYDESTSGRLSAALAPAELWTNLTRFFTTYVPDALHFPDVGALSGDVVERSVWSLMLALFLAAAFLHRRSGAERPSPVWIFLLQPILFTVAYLSSDLLVGTLPDQGLHEYRYFAVPWPFFALAVAVALGGLARLRGGALPVAVGTGVLCLACATATLAWCPLERLGETRAVSGHLGPRFGNTLGVATRGDHELLATIVERARNRDEEEREQLLFGLGQTLKANARPSKKYPKPEREARFAAALDVVRARVAERYRPYFERPVPGEQQHYNPEERARFWRDYEQRQ